LDLQSAEARLKLEEITSKVDGRVSGIYQNQYGFKVVISGNEMPDEEVSPTVVELSEVSVVIGQAVKVGMKLGTLLAPINLAQEQSVYSTHGTFKLVELAGGTTDPINERILRTLIQQAGASVYDREFRTYEVYDKTQMPTSKQFPFHKTMVSIYGNCIDAMGIETRVFGGSQFAVIRADRNRYLIRNSWSE
jgi:hypothetical protein